MRRLIRPDLGVFAVLSAVATVSTLWWTVGVMVDLLLGDATPPSGWVGCLLVTGFVWWGRYGMPYPTLPSPEERRVRRLEREAERQERLALLMERELAAHKRIEAAFDKQLQLRDQED